MSDATGPWAEIEELLDELDAPPSAADPWNGVDLGDATLTDGQVAFLTGLEDQPRIPRLDEPAPGT